MAGPWPNSISRSIPCLLCLKSQPGQFLLPSKLNMCCWKHFSVSNLWHRRSLLRQRCITSLLSKSKDLEDVTVYRHSLSLNLWRKTFCLLGKPFFSLEKLEAEAEPERISHKLLFKTFACFILNWNEIFFCDLKIKTIKTHLFRFRTKMFTTNAMNPEPSWVTCYDIFIRPVAVFMTSVLLLVSNKHTSVWKRAPFFFLPPSVCMVNTGYVFETEPESKLEKNMGEKHES